MIYFNWKIIFELNIKRQFKIQKERLTNDLMKTLNKFQEVQKLSMQKQRESNERAKANMAFNVNIYLNYELFNII